MKKYQVNCKVCEKVIHAYTKQRNNPYTENLYKIRRSTMVCNSNEGIFYGIDGLKVWLCNDCVEEAGLITE